MTTKKEALKSEILSYSIDGKENEVVKDTAKLFELRPNKVLLAQYSRVYLANQRQGNASAKTRAEVSGTTKKIYKQKGTGKARHGSMKAPIFKGGGVVGGPKPHEFRLSISKEQKKKAMQSALAYQAQENAVSLVDNGILKLEAKTKNMQSFLSAAKLENKKVLFVLPDAKAIGLIRSTQNLKNVTCTHLGEVNVFEILNAQHIVIVADAFKTLQDAYFK